MSATHWKRLGGRRNGKSVRKARPPCASARPSLASRRTSRERPVLITGGAGFIGTNLAHRFLAQGQPVRIFDSLARPGVERNLEWLRQTHGDLVQVQVGQVENLPALR